MVLVIADHASRGLLSAPPRAFPPCGLDHQELLVDRLELRRLPARRLPPEDRREPARDPPPRDDEPLREDAPLREPLLREPPERDPLRDLLRSEPELSSLPIWNSSCWNCC